jgi:hypothetical protein
LDVGNLPVPSTLVINEAGTLIAVERVLE